MTGYAGGILRISQPDNRRAQTRSPLPPDPSSAGGARGFRSGSRILQISPVSETEGAVQDAREAVEWQPDSRLGFPVIRNGERRAEAAVRAGFSRGST